MYNIYNQNPPSPHICTTLRSEPSYVAGGPQQPLKENTRMPELLVSMHVQASSRMTVAIMDAGSAPPASHIWLL